MESKLNRPQVFLPLPNGYEKLISPRQQDSTGIVVLFKKCLDVQVCTVFLEPEGRLVVPDVTHVSK